MPVRSPGSRLGGRQRAPGDHRTVLAARLAMTSLVDMLVATVLFLLSFFHGPSCACMPPEGRVPSATNVVDPIDAPLVTVIGDRTLVDGSPAGTEERDVFEVLVAKREIWRQTHPQHAFRGEIAFHIDEHVPAWKVKSMLRAATRAGYPSYSFLVWKVP
jgi:hypothetical protein